MTSLGKAFWGIYSYGRSEKDLPNPFKEWCAYSREFQERLSNPHFCLHKGIYLDASPALKCNMSESEGVSPNKHL